MLAIHNVPMATEKEPDGHFSGWDAASAAHVLKAARTRIQNIPSVRFIAPSLQRRIGDGILRFGAAHDVAMPTGYRSTAGVSWVAAQRERTAR